MGDMRAFLFESEWARALYHDRFPELRRQARYNYIIYLWYNSYI